MYDDSAGGSDEWGQGGLGQSTCVEPDSRELIRSVGTVLHRRGGAEGFELELERQASLRPVLRSRARGLAPPRPADLAFCPPTRCRIRDNETEENKMSYPLFQEDTHTEPEVEDRFELALPLLHLQMIGCPTLFTLTKLPP